MKEMLKYRHPYHLVDASPWPFLMAIAVLTLAIGIIYSLKNNINVLILGLVSWLVVLIGWFRDVTREGVSGKHTIAVQKGLMLGVVLFILSEIMLFMSLFWAFFHSSLAPSIELGGVWPPVGVSAVDPWSIPLVGSLLLLSSGATVTFAHNAIVHNNKFSAITGLVLSILLGSLFVLLQVKEYSLGEFTISDSVFGSVFYLTTGLHGSHVLLGVLFLIVVTWRLYMDQYTNYHHVGLEVAIWYYHFVDIVWLFVFLFFYWWGSGV